MKTRREFLQRGTAASAALLLGGNPAVQALSNIPAAAGSRPNIILILADDMGFADIGCYGSETETPNLDKLAARGIRIAQFYNNPRCCPSRASLLTGLYAPQAGIGLMTNAKPGPTPEYAGDLSPHCVTIAEALRPAGYKTAMSGKWHLTPVLGKNANKHNWPLQRGFDRFFGTIEGAGDYYNPSSLTRDNTPIRAEKGFFYTDAIATNAAAFIDDYSRQSDPFFLYVAFTAPHWPIQGSEEDIAKNMPRYRKGWDAVRQERYERQLKSGLIKPEWALSERDERVPPWELADFKEWEARRMATYAAQVERMDTGIGKIVAKLEEKGLSDNTLILFMSDNGGNYEEIPKYQDKRPSYVPEFTMDGRPVRAGNDPSVMPGPDDTYMSVGIPWGNVLNTPFRLYKHYAHEGGVSTPLIACWPKVIQQKGVIVNQVGHETDMMPTFLELAGTTYPASNAAGPVPALAGESLTPIFQGKTRNRGPIFWEHEGNRAMRDGKWKIVSAFPDYWALYDMEADRTEMHDLADKYPEQVETMARAYRAWANRVGVLAWPLPGRQPEEVRVPNYLRNNK